MIWFSATIFMACFSNITLIYMSDHEKANHCIYRSLCVGSAQLCQDFIHKEKEEEDGQATPR